MNIPTKLKLKKKVIKIENASNNLLNKILQAQGVWQFTYLCITEFEK